MMKKAFALLSLVLVVAMLAGLVGEMAPALTAKAEEPAYYVVDDCDTQKRYTTWQLDAADKKQGRYSLRSSANGAAVELKNSTSMRMDTPENLGDWYLEMWLYLDNVNRLTLRDCSVEMYQNANVYVRWRFSDMGLKKGWNRVQLQVKDANVKTGFANFTEINQVKLNLKTSGNVTVRIDDICLVKDAVASDRTALQAALADAEKVEEATLTAASEEIRATFEAAKAAAAETDADETASQRDVDVAATNLVDAINAFGFDGFTEDLTSEYAYVDYGSMAYAFMDNFLVVGGELTTYSDRGAAGFTDQLLLNPATKYIVDGSNDLRFSFTYYDGEAGGLELYYGSADGVKKALTVELAGSGSWKIATVRVKDAALARSVDGYDLAIKATGDATVYVSRAEVRIITENDLAETDPPEFAEQTEANNVLGAGVFGYQMWFTATASQAGWVHWGEGQYQNPAPGNGNLSFDVYPYVQDYLDNGATLHKSNLGELGDGSQSVLFTSKDPEIVETHFQWLDEYDLDCMAIQRFGCGFQTQLSEEENHLCLARDMAEKYNKSIYVMYDVSGQGGKSYDELYDAITTDFVLNVERAGVSSSPAYAHANGKPVVCIWGITGDPENTNYPKGATASRVVRWFQERGYFVIIGTPDNSYTTRTGEMLEPFAMADMISPWTVGRYAHNSVANWLNSNLAKDLAFCETYDCEYQPVIFPGFSWTTMLHTGKPNAFPRMAGEFIWRQAKMCADAGVTNMYFAMFDEYDEGTAWMKGATDYFEIPKAQYFVTYAADGQWLSNDFYLRTAQKVIKLFNGETTDETLNIPYSQGPLFWRNSFEKRWTTYLTEEDDETIEHTILCNIDVCAPMSATIKNSGVSIIKKADTVNPDYLSVENDTTPDTFGFSREGTGIFRDTTGAYTKSGEWAYQFNATASDAKAEAQQVIASTKIMVSAAGLQLSYSLYAETDLGANVYVDLMLEDDTLVSAKQATISSAHGQKGKWVDVKIDLPESLVGETIKYVLICYKGGAGDVNAYIDDVILQSTGTEKQMLEKAVANAAAQEASEELTAAIEAGKDLLGNAATTKKAMLKAVKEIDNAIREAGDAPVDGMLGDVDGDKAITSTDARLTLQFYAGKITESDLNTALADVDGDGKITSTDARLILQKYAGKIEDFPAA